MFSFDHPSAKLRLKRSETITTACHWAVCLTKNSSTERMSCAKRFFRSVSCRRHFQCGDLMLGIICNRLHEIGEALEEEGDFFNDFLHAFSAPKC